jgi:D-glutamate cyclase
MSENPVQMESIAEAIDRLVTVPMSNWTILKGLKLIDIYHSARDKTGKPLTLDAAERLVEAVKPGDTVIFLTGFVIANFMRAETDGPVGAAALARALDIGLGAVPVLFTEELIREPMVKTCHAAGLSVCDLDEIRTGGRGHKMAVQGFPIDHEEARKEAVKVVETLNPKAVIAIERPGWNVHRIHHSGGGFDISAITAKLDYIFLEAQKRGAVTIGIGDLGNEMGLGTIKDAIRRFIPHAEVCMCPCGGGIATDVSADVGIICNISNWGAYGVEACLAALTGEMEVMHDAATEREMIRACCRAGAIDPVSGLLRPYVDGDHEDIHACVIEMLRAIIKHRTSESIFTKRYRDTWTNKKNQ